MHRFMRKILKRAADEKMKHVKKTNPNHVWRIGRQEKG